MQTSSMTASKKNLDVCCNIPQTILCNKWRRVVEHKKLNVNECPYVLFCTRRKKSLIFNKQPTHSSTDATLTVLHCPGQETSLVHCPLTVKKGWKINWKWFGEWKCFCHQNCVGRRKRTGWNGRVLRKSVGRTSVWWKLSVTRKAPNNIVGTGQTVKGQGSSSSGNFNVVLRWS